MAEGGKKYVFVSLCGRTKRLVWLPSAEKSDKFIITKAIEHLILNDTYLQKHSSGYISIMLKVCSNGVKFDMDEDFSPADNSVIEVDFGYDRGHGIVTTDSTCIIEPLIAVEDDKVSFDNSTTSNVSTLLSGEEMDISFDLKELESTRDHCGENSGIQEIQTITVEQLDKSLQTVRTVLSDVGNINKQQPVAGKSTTSKGCLALPSRFHVEVEEYLKNPAEVMPKDIRNSMVRSIAEAVYTKEMYPTTSDLTQLVMEALELYKPLKTQYGDISGVLIKKISRRIAKLRTCKNKKNLPPKSRKRGPACRKTFLSPGKKAKQNVDLPPESSLLMYRDHVSRLVAEWSKLRPQKDIVVQLLQLTFDVRRHKISTGGGLSMAAILKDFPMFNCPNYILPEFEKVLEDNMIVSHMKEKWAQLIPLLLKYTEKLGKRPPSTEKVWDQYQTSEKLPEDQSRAALQLLPCLLLEQRHQKGTAKQFIFEANEIGTVTVEEAAAMPDRTCPIIIGIGRTLTIAFEQELLVEIPSGKVIDALIMLMAVYYVYDASYPKQSILSLRFIQAAIMNKADSDTNKSTSVRDLICELNALEKSMQ